PAPDDWVRELRRITRGHNIPMIVDEIQTGWGRTGKLYAFQHADITPDILVLSKAIGGGLPLAVLLYDEALDTWAPAAHTGTFRGNQLAMAAGLATLRFLTEESLAEHAEAIGSRLMRHLQELQGAHACVGDVRGRGLMLGVEIVHPDPGTQGNPPPAHGILAREIQAQCLRLGLILEVGGRFGSVIRFLPPLIITAEEVDEVAELFAAAVGRAEKALLA